MRGKAGSGANTRQIIGRQLGRLCLNAILCVLSLAAVFPFAWMVLGAFKPAQELMRPIPSLWPEAPGLQNFQKIFTLFPFGRFFLNSAGVTLVTVAFVLFTSSLLGYIFGKFEFPGRGLAFLLIISSMIVPFEVRVIPMFLLVQSLGWQDSYQALIVPFIIDAFGVYLFREFIRAIPSDYIDAARIDGASEWMIYRRIIVPLTGPVMSALAIFAFVYYWDQLIWPLVVISSDLMKTLPLGILLLSNQRGIIFDLTLAAGLLSVVPNLIIFIVFQRRIVRGVVLAGLKG